MTLEKLLSDVTFGNISLSNAYDEIGSKENTRKVNYYAHISDVRKEPLKDIQLQELNAIVKILQILYSSNIGSPYSDTTYDNLQEVLVDMGIPRLTGTVEINDNKKVSHRFTNLRGTLDKVYYLFQDEERTNKSRKYLDEWIKSTEALYKKNTGKEIKLNDVLVCCQPKMDGTSVVMEQNGDIPLWLSRGDTTNNKASDVSHIMNIFNDVYKTDVESGQKFEVMMPEGSKDKINKFSDIKYKNSRQVVTSILNSNEADFKAEYLFPVPLRIINKDDDMEEIHPLLLEKFPTLICKLSERDKIKEYANNNRYVSINGDRLRTDGVVITILDKDIRKALGRENNINNFEVAYKFTEEYGYTKVKDVEFYSSTRGYVTPVLVTNDIVLKGNTINHISLSNKERFDELNLQYGDEIKILYDIIPYAVIDEKCRKITGGRKIEFIKNCPRCGSELNLDTIQVQCKNPECPSIILGNIIEYCSNLRIQHIGESTIETLYSLGFLKHGIRSLYKLKNKVDKIQDIEGFGKLKTRKIISEIEKKRKLFDYELFGSIGVENLSIKTFKLIFSKISFSDFIEMIKSKNFNELFDKLISIDGIGESKANALILYMKNTKKRDEVFKLIDELNVQETKGITKSSKGAIVFTGCRPNDDIIQFINDSGYDYSDNWVKDIKVLIVPNTDYTSSKVRKALDKNVQILPLEDINKINNL